MQDESRIAGILVVQGGPYINSRDTQLVVSGVLQGQFSQRHYAHWTVPTTHEKLPAEYSGTSNMHHTVL